MEKKETMLTLQSLKDQVEKKEAIERKKATELKAWLSEGNDVMEA